MKPSLTQSAPHIRRGRTTSAIMLDVLIALVPSAIAAVYVFGPRALLLLTVTMAAAAVAQWLCVMMRKGGEFDGSALVTGALLALSLPVGTPLWAAAAAAVFAIAVVKEAFGGIGHNLFNPAMAARGLLLVAFPTLLSGYARPDAVSSATPLSGIGAPEGPAEWLPMLTGTENGSMGETSVLLLLVGGVYLYLRGAIRLRVPMTCLGVFAAVTWVFGGDYGLFTGQRRRRPPLRRPDARRVLYGDGFHYQTHNFSRRASVCGRCGCPDRRSPHLGSLSRRGLLRHPADESHGSTARISDQTPCVRPQISPFRHPAGGKFINCFFRKDREIS